jgi:predicted NBD/HSP70 family sugar kinase
MGEKADSELVRRQNRRLVLGALRRNGPLGRVELGRKTGLSPASITSITSQLIEDGAIEELQALLGATPILDENLALRRGRPIVKLSLKASATHVIGLRISIAGIDMVLADFNGAIIHRQQVKVNMLDLMNDALVHILLDVLPAFVAAAALEFSNINRIGIALQGVANSLQGEIAWSPIFRGQNISITKPLESAFGIPCSIANDTNMMAVGLAMQDQERFNGVSIVVFVGYGVGMAILIDGAVYHGATGASAEFGHMNHIQNGAACRCGKRGCIEAYVADYGIHRIYKDGANNIAPSIDAVPSETMEAMLAQANCGDPSALQAFATSGEVLGYGLARVIALLNPDRIVLGGPGMKASRYMDGTLRQALDDALVGPLRSHTEIEYSSFDLDMIIRGTLTSILSDIETDVFAQGPLVPRSRQTHFVRALETAH